MLSDQHINDRGSSLLEVDCKSDVEKIKTAVILLLIISSVIFDTDDALAYVDPNTGGYIFQLLFPLISVTVFAYLFLKRQVRLLFSRISAFLKGILKKAFSSLGIFRDDIK